MPVLWETIGGALANAEAPPHFGAGGEGVTSARPAPVTRVVLRPNRSLSRKGFAWVLLIFWGFLLIPLVPLLGSSALWIMLPFLLAALAALWFSIEKNYRDGRLYEELMLWPDRITVTRYNPKAAPQSWEASPHWTKLHLRPEGGPVENYLTLKGNGREIELGAFLSPDERIHLHRDLKAALARVDHPASG